MDGNDQSDKGDQMKVEDIRLFFRSEKRRYLSFLQIQRGELKQAQCHTHSQQLENMG